LAAQTVAQYVRDLLAAAARPGLRQAPVARRSVVRLQRPDAVDGLTERARVIVVAHGILQT
jgi:hypothetical protein